MSSQPTSRASRSFLGVIKETVRNRSRSPAPKATQMAQPDNTTRSQAQPSRPAPNHRLSSASTASSSSMQRTSSQSSQGSTDRSQWEKMTYGRHSTDWLFTSQKTLKQQGTDGSNAQS